MSATLEEDNKQNGQSTTRASSSSLDTPRENGIAPEVNTSDKDPVVATESQRPLHGFKASYLNNISLVDFRAHQSADAFLYARSIFNM